MAGCGGAGAELDTSGSTASTGGGADTSIAAATTATALNIAVKPVASPLTVTGK